MIVFEGELTGAAKKHYFKKAAISLARFFGRCVCLVPFAIEIVFVLLEEGFSDEELVRAFLWTPSYTVIFSVIRAFKLIHNAPKKIVIEPDYISVETKNEALTRMTSDIRNIYDYGDFYQIRAESSKTDMYFICQKSLVNEGGLEKFNGLYRGKITKKPEHPILSRIFRTK